MKYRGFEYIAIKQPNGKWTSRVESEETMVHVLCYRDTRKQAYAAAKEYIDGRLFEQNPTWDDVFSKLPKMVGEESWEIPAQAAKVAEEIKEYQDADTTRDKAEELGDVVHSAIKLLHMLGADTVDKLLNPVVEKNRARGYYEE
jgi:NTP pyrophosphatase (non-canonical NTP hydrolase)